MNLWEREHRDALGTRKELKASLDRIFGQLSWKVSGDMLSSSVPFNGNEHACEVSLLGEPGETLFDVSIHSAPPAVRAIMSGLNLNYCYAHESCELYLPFSADDRWPGAAL